MKKQTSQLIFGCAVLTAMFCAESFGASARTEAKLSDLSARSEKRFGAYASVLGDPAPALLGVNAAYNIADFMRASIGFGYHEEGFSADLGSLGSIDQSTSVTTIGFGTRFMVPGWSLTPTVGLSYAHSFYDETQALIDWGKDNVYTSIGIDWQTKGGFNFGAGANINIAGGGPSAPYLNLGWFFDIS